MCPTCSVTEVDLVEVLKMQGSQKQACQLRPKAVIVLFLVVHQCRNLFPDPKWFYFELWCNIFYLPYIAPTIIEYSEEGQAGDMVRR